MAFTVVYDACVLFSPALRDLLIRIGQTDLVRARYSEKILLEMRVAVSRERPHVTAAQMDNTLQLMRGAIRDVIVENAGGLESSLTLPDQNDRHVLATAISCNAQAIVTFNLADFPRERLALHKIEALHPDTFVMDLIDLAGPSVCRVLVEQVAALKNPVLSLAEVIERLNTSGLPRSAARFRDLLRP